MLRVILTSIIVYFITQYICVGNSNILPKRKGMLLYNFLSVFCLYSFFNIFIYDTGISFLIIITFFYLLSLTMFYVHEFRGTNINLSDILSLNTAKEVASGYTYEIKPYFVLALIVILFEYVYHVYNFIINQSIFDKSSNIDIYRFFWREVRHILVFLLSFFILKDKVSQSKFDYSLNAGENEGYIYNFFSSIPILHRNVAEPSDKTATDFVNYVFGVAKENLKNKNTKSAHDYVTISNSIFREYASKNEDAPHIIVIMNESFGSVHTRIRSNYSVTPYFDSLTGVVKGNLYVNTFGGGTANTEFEFLTGMTIGNYPYPVMPYNNFVKRDKYSIVRYFNNLGYKTIAVHPYTSTNYHRNKVYKRFGFNELVFYNDFKNKEYIRNFVSDKSMYDEVIRRFKTVRESKQKLFLFGITMQNHSGYKRFSGQKILSLMSNYKNREAVDSYLSLMKLSDEALEYLINYLSTVNERVILLFFGDHNASFGTEINKLLYESNLEYECSNPYLTPFLIYDNKYKRERFVKEVSANFLSLELLKCAKLPYDIIHEMLNNIYNNYSVYNFHKAKNRKDKKLYDIPIDQFMKLEREYLK